MPKTATSVVSAKVDKIDVLRVYTTCNAIKMALSAKQVDSVFKAGCGVSDLKPDGTASAILPVPVGVKVSLPFRVKMRGRFVGNDGVLTEDWLKFQSFKLLKKAELNTQAVWEVYNVRLTEAD
jgi:hypothetical protein